jgi:hypothetical protein
MRSIAIALQYLNDNEWSVVPILPRTKRPPEGFRVSQYFNHRPTETAVREWFRSECNLAVCLGNVSGGLCVRDFDEVPPYDRWATDYPGLASRLPTVRTARGYHVYFNADVNDVSNLSPSGGSILVGRDGELKSGGYSILPQSTHPTGKRYQWVNPPNDIPYISDILAAGLVPKIRNATQEIVGLGSSSTADVGWLDLTVEQAIECSQPTGHGERHFRIFDLCRMLKSTALVDATEAGLRPVFEHWFRLARPRIKTKRFRTSWIEFLSGWPRVKRSYGATIATIAKRAHGQGIERLESLCRELQLIAGEQPFHLDCRTAGKVLGVHYTSAARWLRILCDGPLECTRIGDHLDRRSSEYRYIGKGFKTAGTRVTASHGTCGRRDLGHHVTPVGAGQQTGLDT